MCTRKRRRNGGGDGGGDGHIEAPNKYGLHCSLALRNKRRRGGGGGKKLKELRNTASNDLTMQRRHSTD